MSSREVFGRDPLDILIHREQQTCKGCKWLIKYIVFNEEKTVCEKNRKTRNSKCYEESPGKTYCQGGK